MTETLFQEIKTYLDITWDDPATDQKLEGIISAGIHYLEGKAGEALDFENQPDALMLLKDYVRYGRDSALDVFENNYRHLILDLQHSRQIARRQEESNEKSAVSPGQ